MTMKKHLVAALILIPLCGLTSFAQTTTTPSAPTTAEIVARRVERLTTLLTLTTAQQAQATTIFTTEVTAESSLQTSMSAARTALKAAIQKNDTATIDAQSAQIGSLTTQLVLSQAKADAAFYLTLTADQQTKYAQLQTGGGGGFGGRGPGGPH